MDDDFVRQNWLSIKFSSKLTELPTLFWSVSIVINYLDEGHLMMIIIIFTKYCEKKEQILHIIH